MTATPVRIGIIGGTGLDDADILKDAVEVFVDTPFGKPSDALKLGTIDDVPCILLSRHGRKHNISPSNINYRANIWALKQHGCTHILVSTACGSLQENVKPGQIVFLDQFIDRTYKRSQSFYDGRPGGPIGVCHIPMDEPFCPEMRKILIDVATDLKIHHFANGTAVCIEGPRYSSKAESHLFRQWNAHLVNMTVVPKFASPRNWVCATHRSQWPPITIVGTRTRNPCPSNK
jgi:5'-methylthioadenosine phosphorylase